MPNGVKYMVLLPRRGVVFQQGVCDVKKLGQIWRGEWVLELFEKQVAKKATPPLLEKLSFFLTSFLIGQVPVKIEFPGERFFAFGADEDLANVWEEVFFFLGGEGFHTFFAIRHFLLE